MRSLIISVFMLYSLLLHLPLAGQVPLEEVGHYGENIGVVSVDGTRGVINEGTRLRVVDVSNPGTPLFQGSVDLGTAPQGVHVSGDYAYVAGYTGVFSVVNIANPNAPFVEGSLDWLDWKESVWARRLGDYAYVGVCDGVQVIDVRDKSQPVGVFDIQGLSRCINSITGDGGYLYVVSDGQDTRFRVYSLADPAAPVLIGSAPGNSFYSRRRNSVAVFGDTLYLGQENGTIAYDIADRTQPRVIGKVESEDGFFENALDVDRGILHSAHWGRIDFWNLANPNAPVGAGQLYSGPNHIATDVDAFSGFSLAARSIALTVSTPDGSIQTVRELTPDVGWAESVVTNGQYLYLGTGPGIAVLSVSNPVSPSLVRFVNTRWASDMKIQGNHLYNLSPWGFLEVYSLADPTNPAKVFDDYPIQGGIDSIKLDVSASRVAATANNQLVLYTRNPDGSLVEESRTTLPTAANGVALNGTLAYTASVGGELRVYDTTIPATPALVHSVDLFPGSDAPGFNCDVEVSGGRLHVFVGRQGYLLMDLSNPAQPTVLDSFESFQMEGRGVVADGNVVYLIAAGWNGRDGIRALDISNPTDISQVATARATGLTMRAAVLGDYIYVVERLGVLRVRNKVPQGTRSGGDGWLID